MAKYDAEKVKAWLPWLRSLRMQELDDGRVLHELTVKQTQGEEQLGAPTRAIALYSDKPASNETTLAFCKFVDAIVTGAVLFPDCALFTGFKDEPEFTFYLDGAPYLHAYQEGNLLRVVVSDLREGFTNDPITPGTVHSLHQAFSRAFNTIEPRTLPTTYNPELVGLASTQILHSLAIPLLGRPAPPRPAKPTPPKELEVERARSLSTLFDAIGVKAR